ncbi:trophoblast glycoprotein-like isoform X1 [Branchiostoma floridae x Branchiostoma belcheri]
MSSLTAGCHEQSRMGRLVLCLGVVVLAWVTVVSGQARSPCPAGCRCNVPNQIVDCSGDQQMALVPSAQIPIGTRELYLNRTKITNLIRNQFANLVAMSVLDLSYNQLYFIDAGAFFGLGNLQELSLQFNNLTAIPPMFLPRLAKLKLYNNHLVNITAGAFRDLSGLTHLYLSSIPTLQMLHDNAFQGLNNLVLLSIRKNNLKKIPTLQDIPNIVTLDLSVNNFTTIKNTTFRTLNKLKELKLGSCNIQSIEAGTFADNYALEKLDLTNNKLETLPENLFFPFEPSHALDEGLNIALWENPWLCDCNLQWLTDSIERIGAFDPVTYIPLVCDAPRHFKGKFLEEIPKNQLECGVFITSAVDQSQVVQFGGSLVIDINAEGKPQPIVRWATPTGTIITAGQTIKGVSVSRTGKLTVAKIDASHHGTWQCRADNVKGQYDIVPFKIVVTDIPKPTTRPPPVVVIPPKKPAVKPATKAPPPKRPAPTKRPAAKPKPATTPPKTATGGKTGAKGEGTGGIVIDPGSINIKWHDEYDYDDYYNHEYNLEELLGGIFGMFIFMLVVLFIIICLMRISFRASASVAV